MWDKYFGGCNDIKNELNMCMRKEVRAAVPNISIFDNQYLVFKRIERTKRNNQESKVRTERRRKALEELHKDD